MDSGGIPEIPGGLWRNSRIPAGISGGMKSIEKMAQTGGFGNLDVK